MPSGYNPVQVEETLARIAEHLENGELVPSELFDVDFDAVSAGFDPDHVAEFFAKLKDIVIASTAAVASVPAEEVEADEQPVVEPDDASAAEPVANDGVGGTFVEEEVEPVRRGAAHPDRMPAAPAPVAGRPVTSAPTVITSGLPGAVERTKLAVAELEAFVIQQMEEAKAALRLHIDQTQTDCLNTLDTARTVSDQALDTARQRAEVLLDVATRTTNQLRDRFEGELASMRTAFEEDLARRHAAIRADLEALVEEAKDLTEEAHTQLTQVHDDVRTSLEDARSILTNPTRRLAA
jgi:hypothetical protein